MSTISSWLIKNGLGKYTEQFESNDIDLDILPELTQDDLRELGLSLGHQKRFLKVVRNLSAEIAGGSISSVASLSASSEHRQLTVMFCDLADSTWLVNQIGAESMQELYRDYREICAQAISRYSGYIAQYLGDGVVVYFGYPQAHEQDTDRSIKAGLLLLELMKELSQRYQQQLGIELGVRIGIATGPVVVGDVLGENSIQETAVVGETPNLAARIQSIAPNNSIAVSDRTHRLALRSFEFADIGLHTVKGIADPIQVWHVTSESSLKSRFEATLRVLDTDMIGREEEFSLLTSRWNSSSAGDGQIVNITGEAGIGKSQLVEKFLQSVESAESQSMHLQCSPYHGIGSVSGAGAS